MLSHVLTLERFLLLAGCLHFMQLPAMMAAPKMLDWKEDLGKLSLINRRIVQVIGLGIMLMLMGAGVIVVVASHDLAQGGRLATAFCGYLAFVWAYRGSVQLFLYSRIWPGGFMGRLSHYGLSALMCFLAAIYFWGFLHGITR